MTISHCHKVPSKIHGHRVVGYVRATENFRYNCDNLILPSRTTENSWLLYKNLAITGLAIKKRKSVTFPVFMSLIACITAILLREVFRFAKKVFFDKGREQGAGSREQGEKQDCSDQVD